MTTWLSSKPCLPLFLHCHPHPWTHSNQFHRLEYTHSIIKHLLRTCILTSARSSAQHKPCIQPPLFAIPVVPLSATPYSLQSPMVGRCHPTIPCLHPSETLPSTPLPAPPGWHLISFLPSLTLLSPSNPILFPESLPRKLEIMDLSSLHLNSSLLILL